MEIEPATSHANLSAPLRHSKNIRFFFIFPSQNRRLYLSIILLPLILEHRREQKRKQKNHCDSKLSQANVKRENRNKTNHFHCVGTYHRDPQKAAGFIENIKKGEIKKLCPIRFVDIKIQFYERGVNKLRLTSATLTLLTFKAQYDTAIVFL